MYNVLKGPEQFRPVVDRQKRWPDRVNVYQTDDGRYVRYEYGKEIELTEEEAEALLKRPRQARVAKPYGTRR